jgi:hypothetical protein
MRSKSAFVRPVVIVNVIIVVLEIIALIHDCMVFGPALSVISLLFLEKTQKQPMRIVLWPAVVSLLYGAICLVLNACRVLDGPYFFLQVHEQPAGVIALWFGIIAVLCLGLSLLYYWIKWGRVLSCPH